MSIFKRTFIAMTLGIAMLVPLVSFAETDNSALIASLLAQIKALQAQLQTLQSQQNSGSCHTFTKNLKVGDSGSDVFALIRALEQGGSISYGEAGSGPTTSDDAVFTENVASAVTGFQEKYKDEILTPNGLKYGTGYVGKSTRAKLNQLYGCSGGGGGGGIYPPPPLPPPAPPQPITVTAPNGGEQWQLGSSHTILWSPYDPQAQLNVYPTVQAYLDRYIPNNFDGKFVQVGKVMPAGKASIHWIGEIDTYGNYPPPGNNYSIRLVNTATGQTARSNSSFTLVAQGTIHADLKVNGSDGPINVTSDGKPIAMTASWESNADTCSIYNNTASTDAERQINNLPSAGNKMINVYPNFNSYNISINLWCTAKVFEGQASDNVEVLPVTNGQSFVSVAVPNGGEQIDFNTSYTINVQHTTDIARLSLVLYKNNASFRYIVADLPVSPQTTATGYIWTPSNTLTATELGSAPGAVWKIYAIAYKNSGGTVTDMSDAPFSIVSATTSQPSITVLSPNGGETVAAGAQLNVQWNWTGSPTNLNIRLVNNSAVPLVMNLATGIDSTVHVVSGVTPSNYTVTIPSSINGNTNIAGSNYKIQICDNYLQNGSLQCDSSDASFSIVAQSTGTLIPSDTFVSFNVVQGQSNPPAYNLHLTNGSTASVNFMLSVPNQPSWLNCSYNIQTMTLNPGGVMGVCVAADATKISGSGTYTTNLVVSGNFTGSPLTIPVTLTVTSPTTQPSITVLSPNGGETWNTGETHNITWLGAGSGIQILLYPWSVKNMTGSSYNPTAVIAMSAPNTGSFSWIIPTSIPSGQYFVRVFCTSNCSTNALDDSDAPFNIVAPPTPTPALSVNVSSDKTTGIAPLAVTFTATATNAPSCGVTQSWTFGDGSPSESTTESCTGTASTMATRTFTHSHTYSSAGTYSTQVTINSVVSNTVTITATGATAPSFLNWQGHTWKPVYVTYGSDPANGYGNWNLSGSYLAQDQVSSLHYKIVGEAPASQNYEVSAIFSLRAGQEFGICARLDDNGNGYCFSSGSDGYKGALMRFANNDQNPEVLGIGAPTYTGSTILLNVDHRIKLRVEGNMIRGKLWVADNPEPSRWNIEFSDSLFTAGKAGFYTYRSQPNIKSFSVVPLTVAQTSPTSSLYTANALSAIKTALDSIQAIINQMTR